ncbi:MAG TPA: hypothetical protein VN939_22185 [Chthoniobacterales bacterium]|jgi:hypothetical protein|nr:hypothetical protein [Chthoniobacterales bacterium]
MRKGVWLPKNRRRIAAAGSIIGRNVAGARGSRPRKRGTLHGLALTAFPLAAGLLGVPTPSPSAVLETGGDNRSGSGRRRTIPRRARHQVVFEVSKLAQVHHGNISRAQGILQYSHDPEFVEPAVDAILAVRDGNVADIFSTLGVSRSRLYRLKEKGQPLGAKSRKKRGQTSQG